MSSAPPPIRASSWSRLTSPRLNTPSLRPWLRIVNLSPTGSACWTLCVMKMTASPRARAFRMCRRTIAACLTPSADVGSSRMRTRAPKYSARAIASVWRSPPGQRAHELAGVADVDADLEHLLARRLVGVPHVEPPERTGALRGLVAQEEVPADAHERQDREVLEHGRDAAGLRVARRRERDGLAVHEQLALVGTVDARQGLDQGRLAGAVVAEQAVHLAGLHGQRHVPEGEDAAERLRDAPRLEDGDVRARRSRGGGGAGGGQFGRHDRAPEARRRM